MKSCINEFAEIKNNNLNNIKFTFQSGNENFYFEPVFLKTNNSVYIQISYLATSTS